MRGPAPQQHVGEPSGGRPGVQAAAALHLRRQTAGVKGVKGARELAGAAGDVVVAPRHHDLERLRRVDLAGRLDRDGPVERDAPVGDEPGGVRA